MEILWNSSSSMTASQIVNSAPELTMNTVQAILRKLLKRGFIEVADIVYSGTVLSRSYRPAISHSDFVAGRFHDELSGLKGELSTSDFVVSLLKTETDHEKVLNEIDELEKILKQYKERIQQEGDS